MPTRSVINFLQNLFYFKSAKLKFFGRLFPQLHSTQFCHYKLHIIKKKIKKKKKTDCRKLCEGDHGSENVKNKLHNFEIHCRP